MAADLIQILPEYFRPVLEFQKIMDAHSCAMNVLEEQAERVRHNCFIQTADPDTLKMYEELFRVIHKPGETIEYRRKRILQMYNIIAPFSIGFLKSRLTELFGDEYSLEVDSVNNTLKILVTSSQYGAVDLLYSLIWDVVPMHLEVTANHEVTNDIQGNIYTAAILTGTFIQTI